MPGGEVSGAVVWGRWAVGETGLPLVDAAMRELVATGYTSNRCRQNARLRSAVPVHILLLVSMTSEPC